MTRPEPTTGGETPTLASRIKLDISSTRRAGGIRNFVVAQDNRIFTFDLSRYPALILSEFFNGTHFPTVEDMTNRLPEAERENFFGYLQELNETIADKLRMTLDPTIKVVNNRAVTFLVTKSIPRTAETD